MTTAWRTSLGLHFALAITFFLVAWVGGQSMVKSKPVKISIQEITAPPKVTEPPVVKTRSTPRPLESTPAKPVFGLTNTSHTSDQTESVEIKAGNTLAKAPDNEFSENANALPSPTEEYLVTEMPRLKSEVRINYPAEARAKNIEGAVVMDILIDDTGKVRDAKLIQGPGYGLNEAALEAIYRFAFHPARVGQSNVPVRIRYAYRFVLN